MVAVAFGSLKFNDMSANEQQRIDWIENALKKIPKGLRILDAGAGEQQYKKFCGHLDYVSQDFAQYDPNKLNNGLQMPAWDYGKLDIVSDITAIPEPNESFDVILCTEVFEHIPDPISAIKEFSRLLKSNGTLIITAPFCSMTHFAPYHFYSGFNSYFYEKHLLENNFKINYFDKNGNYFEYVRQELSRSPYIANQYANSKLTFIEKIGLKISLKMLKRFSAKDTNSSDLLNFGFHVVATKK
jgi:ubiquinone/menaquinone biosynthesis C-methylase UbiE